jgi:hypothetical protein
MNDGANRITTMKMDENRAVVQKKKKPVPKRAKSIKERNSKSQSAPCCPHDGATIAGTKRDRDVDFLKAIEEKRKARWIDLDQILYSPEFLRGTCYQDFLSLAPTTKSSNTDFSQSISKPYPVGSKYFEGGRKLETLRHLESRREEILREIFMGLRFSFTPASRQMVFEMNVTPSSEKGPGFIIPF